MDCPYYRVCRVRLKVFLGQGEMFMDGAGNKSIDNYQKENIELRIKNIELQKIEDSYNSPPNKTAKK